jgi:hypothetical protein
MDRQTNKWSEIQTERGYGFPPLIDPTSFAAPECSGLRIRKEDNSRDFMNSRLWDNFHATPPTQVSHEVLKTKEGPKHMDMNPTCSRKSDISYRKQVEYMPRNQLPSAKNSENPYLQRLDAEGSDARNIARELRSAVTEDTREQDIDAAKKMAERQFMDRWMPRQMSADASSLQAYELLRPKQYSDYDS